MTETISAGPFAPRLMVVAFTNSRFDLNLRARGAANSEKSRGTRSVWRGGGGAERFEYCFLLKQIGNDASETAWTRIVAVVRENFFNIFFRSFLSEKVEPSSSMRLGDGLL